MEISSEHGHNIRDEDIDIDIDFTTGHADEDYILEDVLPHETIDNDFLFEASPGAGQDDLMVDEGEDESFDAPKRVPAPVTKALNIRSKSNSRDEKGSDRPVLSEMQVNR